MMIGSGEEVPSQENKGEIKMSLTNQIKKVSMRTAFS